MPTSTDQPAYRHDPWEPRCEPARTLYLAFREEATRRKGRAIEEWISAERDAVWKAACAFARANGLDEPSIELVARAERYAMGSTDYGATWAYTLERLMAGAPVKG